MSQADESNSHSRRNFIKSGVAGALAVASPNVSWAKGSVRFDTIIVGGGSAGAVLARRLSEDSARQVLLLEAGTAYATDAYPDAVLKQTIIGGDAAHDWGYRSIAGYMGREIPLPRGKVLGGSSAINGSVAMRTPKVDHDRWAREYGLTGWSWDDALAANKRLERTSAGSDEFHGRSGPLPIHQLGFEENTDMQRAFVEAAVERGYPRVSDFNSRDPFGASPYPMNTRMGNRLNTGLTYLDAATRARPNLTIRGDAEVDAVMIAKKRAIGIRLINGEEILGGEIIVSGGSYGSPAILMRSGIGPAADLRKLDIPVVENLPVGQRLQDHPFYFTVWAGQKDRLGLGFPPIGSMLWARSKQAAPDDLDLNITAVHFGNPADSPTGAIFMLAVANTRPVSIGSLKLRSRDPRAAPLIDLAFLKEKRDRDGLVDGIEIARELAATAPLANLIHSELIPGRAIQSRGQLEAGLAGSLDTYHHPTSTVPMGGESDDNAVLDAAARVRGIKNLRVVDASIFPDIPSVATNLSTIMAAEHIAAMITK